MNFGIHAPYIWGSYGAAVLVLGGLIAWLVADGRRQAGRLTRLEARGVRRRSAEAVPGAAATSARPPAKGV